MQVLTAAEKDREAMEFTSFPILYRSKSGISTPSMSSLAYYHLYTNMLLNCSGQCWFLQRWEMGADNLVWANIALVLLHPVLQLCPAAPYWVMNIAMWRVPHGGAVGWSCRTYWSLNIDPLGPVDDQVWKSN